MESFLIKGGNKLNGDVSVSGSKNAALKLIAATLLTEETCRLTNVPHLKDVEVMLDILRSMGAEVEFKDDIVIITNKNINPEKLSFDLTKRLRASVVLIGPILARFGEISLPYPGGDKIGARSLSTHFNIFRDLGFIIVEQKDKFTIRRPQKLPLNNKVVLDEFSVTATENVLMWAAGQDKKLMLSIVAEEPHIHNLVAFLKKMGAKIKVYPHHKIVIEGLRKPKGASQKIIFDYIEAGTWVVAGLVLGGDINIHNFPTHDLELFLHRLGRIGANIQNLEKNILKVRTSPNLKSFKIDARLHPGIASDLQSPLGVLATQCNGTSEVFDTIYEGRLNYLKQLKKMGANVKIFDIHRAHVSGPTKLHGIRFMKKDDIRGGMSLIIAGLAATGETFIRDAYQVDRGYEKIDEKLRALGADIKRI